MSSKENRIFQVKTKKVLSEFKYDSGSVFVGAEVSSSYAILRGLG